MAKIIGRKVFGIDGPGQSPGREGEIVGIENNAFGTFALIEWESGHVEPHTLRNIMTVGEGVGIGVYYAEGVDKHGSRD